MRKSIIVSLLIVSVMFAGEKYTLEQCLEIARKNNPDLEISNRQIKISEQQQDKAFGRFLPSINAGISSQHSAQGEREYMNGGVKMIQPETSSDYYNVGLDVRQTLYNSNIFSGYKLAKNGYLQSKLTKNQTRQYLIFDVTDKFYKYLKAAELLKVYEKAHKNSLEQLKKNQEMYKLGQVAQKDVLKAKVQEGRDRLNIITQKKNLQTAATNLKAAMGLKPDSNEIKVYEAEYKPVKGITLETAKEYSYKNNTNLRLLKKQKQNAALQYQMARAAYLPSLSAGFSYSRGGNQFDRMYNETDKWWNRSLSINLSIPIFDGFRKKREVQIKKIEYNIYDEKIRKEKISLVSNIDDLVKTLSTYKEMLEINKINLQSAKEDLRLAREMYNLNSATFLEVLDAQAALTKAESDIIAIKYDMKIVESQLKLAMGTL